MFRRYTVLRAPAGEEGPGTGQGQPNDPPGDGGAASVTPELTKFVNDTVSKAIGKRLGDFESKQTKTLERFQSDLTTAVGQTLEEKLAAFKPSDEGDKGKNKTTVSDDITKHPEFKAIAKANEDLKKRLDQSDAEKQAQRGKTRDGELRKLLTDRLLAEGADPKRVRHAVGILVDVDKLVAYEDDDSDAVVFREADGTTTLDSGVKSWVQSEDGKSWLPPRNAAGSGDGPKGTKTSAGSQQQKSGAQGNGAPPSKKDIGTALLAQVLPGQGT